MNFIKKHLSSFAFLYFILIISIFSGKLFLPYEGIDSEESAKEQAAERSVLVEWCTASWSGIILSSNLSETKILTIFHEESMKKISSSQTKKIRISLENGKKYEASVKKWNNCNELSVFTIPSSTLSNLPAIRLEPDTSKISERLFSFGHPLGLNLHYAEGFLTSKGNKIKPCGMITNGFSGGTIPGQTGSGIWNFKGELSGMIVATSAYPIKTSDSKGNIIGSSTIPITFLGRYIPSYEIKSFLQD
jgi:S1-C subfamily serine protease